GEGVGNKPAVRGERRLADAAVRWPGGPPRRAAAYPGAARQNLMSGFHGKTCCRISRRNWMSGDIPRRTPKRPAAAGGFRQNNRTTSRTTTRLAPALTPPPGGPKVTLFPNPPPGKHGTQGRSQATNPP